jgi:hypothetical protein
MDGFIYSQVEGRKVLQYKNEGGTVFNSFSWTISRFVSFGFGPLLSNSDDAIHCHNMDTDEIFSIFDCRELPTLPKFDPVDIIIVKPLNDVPLFCEIQ